MKRSQITLFMIIGIVLIISFSFIFYISNTLNSVKKNEKTSILSIPEKLRPVKNLIDGCLEEAAKEGMWLIGKQGGVIYEFQGGNETLSGSEGDDIRYFQKGLDTSINFAVRKFNDGVEENYVMYRLCGLTKIDEILCNPEVNPSTNSCLDLLNSDLEKELKCQTLPILGSKITQPRQYKDSRYFLSMQNNLREFILKNTSECIDDFSVLREKGYDIEVSDQFNLDINFSFNSKVSFSLLYPIEVKNDNLDLPLTKLDKFFTSLDIRFGLLYSKFKQVIDLDSKVLDYDIQEGDIGDDFSINTFRFDNYDVIRIYDDPSLIDGEKFYLQFIRENRWPRITKLDSNPWDGSKITSPSSTIEAKDPDEDTLTCITSVGSCTPTGNTFALTFSPGDKGDITIKDSEGKYVEIEVDIPPPVS